MLNLSCGQFEIPLCFVQAISWQKRARAIQHTGGYVSSRGFEPVEISVKLHIDFATCKAFDLKAQDIFSIIDSTATNRVSPTGVFYLGRYAIYPTLEFALTNINKTYSPERGMMECDCVWSGCKVVKNVARENALEIQPSMQMPHLTMAVNGRELVLQDFCHISRFVTTPDSIQLAVSIGSDLDLVNREGFLKDILSGTVTADLPQGVTKYYIIEADLTDELLSITGSIFPPQSAQIITRTYMDTDISEIIKDLANECGIEVECKVTGSVDYYCAFGNPLQCLKSVQQGAGFIMSYRQGKLTCVDVPSSLNAEIELEYIDLQSDTDSEPIHGCYWYDGINQDSSGILDATSIQVYSPFRSGGRYAQKCLALARYNKNSVIVQAEILQTLDTHSLVFVRSNDSIISGMAEWIEFDWISNMMSVELHYTE